MSPDSLLGQTLDEYRLVAVLGRGGMARVYRGLDLNLQRFVAIKVIDTQYRDDPDYVARFEREARTIAQLDHPHIVRLYRYGSVDGLLYMAMQLVPGASLEYILASYRADSAFLEPADACRLLREVCLALDYAHAQGVIHRDVKPSNILLDQQGRAILTDFGLALLATVGTRGHILGSPHYVAPEQALSSAQAVPQSDLYALGVILYEIFTGVVPFDAPDPMDVALMQVQAAPRPPRSLRPEISPALEAVVLKALAKEPAQRYPTGAALVSAVEQALQAESVRPLLSPPATLSRLSIPDRVAVQMARHAEARPAAPAAPALPPALPQAPPMTAPQAPIPWLGAAPTSRRPPMGRPAGLGVIVALLFLVGCGLLSVWLGTRAVGLLGQLGSPRTATVVGGGAELTRTPALAVTSTVAPALPTAQPTSAPPPTAAPTLSPAPPAGPELLIIKGEGDNSLVVINRGSSALLLAPLTLRAAGDDDDEGNGAIEGSDWGLAELPSGACVGAWRAGRRQELPEGVTCELVGEAIERGGRDRFWRETFAVFYDGTEIAECQRREQLCTVSSNP